MQFDECLVLVALVGDLSMLPSPTGGAPRYRVILRAMGNPATMFRHGYSRESNPINDGDIVC